MKKITLLEALFLGLLATWFTISFYALYLNSINNF